MRSGNIQFSNQQQFEKLFTTYYPELVIYLCKYVKEIAIAEDLAQELFCELWNKKSTYQIHSNIQAFLYRAARNAAINYLTRIKRMTVELSRELEDEIVFREDIETIERDKKLYALIDRLPEQRKRIFTMCVFEGVRYADVAKHFNISINTVKTQMGRALMDLKKAANELLLCFLLKNN